LYNLEHLTLADLSHASGRLRKLGDGAETTEEIADRIARFLHEEFGAQSGEGKPVILARVYKTHLYEALPPDLQAFATKVAGVTPAPKTACLVLLATAGIEEGWNSRKASAGHQAIPLLSVEAVRRLPMVAQLITQLGFDVSTIVAADPALLIDKEKTAFNVFHVPDALGSPFIPAQKDFVVRYGVKSVLGFGGALPAGELYSAILFSKTAISRDTAEMFKPIALATRLALMTPTEQVFSDA
jgi:two-component system, NtrC family, sensor kinase